MKKEKMKYDIIEELGVVSKQEDLHTDWCKMVLKTLLTYVDSGDSEEGIDIRSMNVNTKIKSSRGIRLTIEEAHNVVDILLENGYGSTEAIEKAYKNRMEMEFIIKKELRYQFLFYYLIIQLNHCDFS